MHAWKVVIPPERQRPQLRTHEGYEWLYVLSGELRLILGGHDITMKAGEVAEFDTQVPHWFGAAGDRPVEILSLLGKHGERIHIRAAPRRKNGDAMTLATTSVTGRPLLATKLHAPRRRRGVVQRQRLADRLGTAPRLRRSRSCRRRPGSARRRCSPSGSLLRR